MANRTRVLVTGGGGFIGSHVCRALLQKAFEVRVLDNFSTGSRENLSELASHIEVIEGDVRNDSVVGRAIEGAQLIIHLAAKTSVPLSIENPHETIEINTLGTLNVFEKAARSDVKRILVASSCSVYGDSGNLPLAETVKTHPRSPYAVSKIQGEELGEYYLAHHKLSNTHFRIFNVYGPRQDPRSEYAAVIPKFIKSILENKPPVIFGNGLQLRDFIYVEDVALAFSEALSTVGSLPLVMNLGCGKAYTLLEMLAQLENFSKKPIAPNFQPERMGDIFYSCADISLMKKALNFMPRTSFEQGLRQTFEWFRETKATGGQLVRRP